MSLNCKWEEVKNTNKYFRCYKAMDEMGGFVYVQSSLVKYIQSQSRRKASI